MSLWLAASLCIGCDKRLMEDFVYSARDVFLPVSVVLYGSILCFLCIV